MQLLPQIVQDTPPAGQNRGPKSETGQSAEPKLPHIQGSKPEPVQQQETNSAKKEEADPDNRQNEIPDNFGSMSDIPDIEYRPDEDNDNQKQGWQSLEYQTPKNTQSLTNQLTSQANLQRISTPERKHNDKIFISEVIEDDNNLVQANIGAAGANRQPQSQQPKGNEVIRAGSSNSK